MKLFDISGPDNATHTLSLSRASSHHISVLQAAAVSIVTRRLVGDGMRVEMAAILHTSSRY